MTLAGVASASTNNNSKCINLWFITICPPSGNPSPVRAPEIDPASAMAGLTMLAGGLAVLRGRRRVIFKK
jgi:hypothetical protein